MIANTPGVYTKLSVLLILSCLFLIAAAITVVILGWQNRRRRGDIDIVRRDNFRLQREISTLRLMLYFADADRKRRLVLLKQTEPGKHHDEHMV